MKIAAIVLLGVLACTGAIATVNAATPTTASERAMAIEASTLRDTLLNSTSARDRALGARLYVFDTDDASTDAHKRNDNTQSLRQAARDAPEDALVQWLAANSQSSALDTEIEAIAALKRLEADNGAVWLLALIHAHKQDDMAGVDEALARMAASTRFDDHYGETLHAWIEIYTRFPPAPIREPDMPQDTAFVMAMAQAGVVAMPYYRALLKICKPDQNKDTTDGAGASSEKRLSHCAIAARLMLTSADTLLSRTVGYGVLDKLGDTYLSDADRSLQREMAWYRHVAGTRLHNNPAALDAFARDWRSQRSEIEVIRSALRRANLPLTAPADWVDPYARRSRPE